MLFYEYITLSNTFLWLLNSTTPLDVSLLSDHVPTIWRTLQPECTLYVHGQGEATNAHAHLRNMDIITVNICLNPEG
jgi:thiamine phosphate synthase YjbQ (UPF0047 family)